MRLISKERDCYDFNFSNNKDDDLFIRKNELLALNDKANKELIDKNKLLYEKSTLYSLFPNRPKYQFLYFCGKVYVLPTNTLNLNNSLKNLFKNEEMFLKQSNKYNKNRYVEELKNKKLIDWHGKDYNNEVFEYLNCAYFKITYIPIDIKNEFTIYKPTIEKYPTLQKLNFQSILTPQQIYNEVERYVSNFLFTKEKELIKISDKDLRDSKGFDNYSFKKRKS